MTLQPRKSNEIRRLTTPLTIERSLAYDTNGIRAHLSESLYDVRLVVEPKEDILSDDEKLQFAPQSKAASEIRLKRGFGTMQDILYLHESVPWVMGLYYVVLICISVPFVFDISTLSMFILLILYVLPLVYMYRNFRLDAYKETAAVKKPDTPQIKQKTSQSIETPQYTGIQSLKKYDEEIRNLNVLFDVKQEVARNLIEKRFEPPQITYDKFINIMDKSEKVFNTQAESAKNIIDLAVEDTPRVHGEIESKIDAMKTIIHQIEDLTNELVINISSSDASGEEVQVLLDDMEDLTDSVKDY